MKSGTDEYTNLSKILPIEPPNIMVKAYLSIPLVFTIKYIITAEITKYKLSVPPQPSDITNSEPPINILLPTRFASVPKTNNRNKVRYLVIKSSIGLKI